MFANLDGWKLIVLLLVAAFVLGPERLPKMIGDVSRVLRRVRQMARSATDELSRELGTPVNVEDLHPKAFIRRHLLSEEDEALVRKPFDDVVRDVGEISHRIQETSTVPDTATRGSTPTPGPPPPTHAGAIDSDAT